MFQKYRDVLTEFRQYGGNGIVYGGCLRDTLTGQGPIKDVDIAVEVCPEEEGAIAAFAEESCAQIKVQFIGHDYTAYPDVAKSTQVYMPDGLLLNFVHVRFPVTLWNVAERCDFGICQIALDWDNLVHFTEAFARDKANKTFTYMRDPSDEPQLVRSIRRWERLSQKYPDWKMVVPETA